jgi:hypothetical protein
MMRLDIHINYPGGITIPKDSIIEIITNDRPIVKTTKALIKAIVYTFTGQIPAAKPNK